MFDCEIVQECHSIKPVTIRSLSDWEETWAISHKGALQPFRKRACKKIGTSSTCMPALEALKKKNNRQSKIIYIINFQETNIIMSFFWLTFDFCFYRIRMLLLVFSKVILHCFLFWLDSCSLDETQLTDCVCALHTLWFRVHSALIQSLYHNLKPKLISCSSWRLSVWRYNLAKVSITYHSSLLLWTSS